MSSQFQAQSPPSSSRPSSRPSTSRDREIPATASTSSPTTSRPSSASHSYPSLTHTPRLGSSQGTIQQGRPILSSSSSPLPSRPTHFVQVYNSDIYNELLQSAALEQHMDQQKERRKKKKIESNERLRHVGSSISGSHARSTSPTKRSLHHPTGSTSQARLDLFWAHVKKLKEHRDRKLKEKMAHNQALEQVEFNKMVKSLDESKDFLSDIDAYIKLKDQTDFRKRELLYKAWCEQVFTPIQSQILGALDSTSTASLEKQRRAIFEEYLSVTNRKHGVYLDSIFEKDYNPFKSRGFTLKYKVGHLHDPLQADWEKRNEESKINQVLHEEQVDIVPTLKPTFPASMWSKVESTPHGRYSDTLTLVPTFTHSEDEDGGQPLSPTTRAEIVARRFGKKAGSEGQNKTQSSVVFDQYNTYVDMNSVSAAYWTGGKKIGAGKESKVGYNILTQEWKPNYVKDESGRMVKTVVEESKADVPKKVVKSQLSQRPW